MGEAVLDYINTGKPFLGICLGLQLLFTESLEHGRIKCLGLIDGTVRPFEKKEGIKVPQIGWNTLSIRNSKCPLFRGLKDGDYFYFVHSYYCDSRCPEYTAGSTFYGKDYVSAIWKENVYAVQFHPERSQEKGIQILRNFIRI
jgi:glutamine amidotransferase